MTQSEKKKRLSKLERIQLKIKNALKEIEKEEKVIISFGSTKYDLVSFVTPMTIIETAKTTEVKENTLDKDKKISMSYGFAGNIIGMEYNGGKIKEFKTRNRKYPIIFEKIVNGVPKSYKTTLGSVKLSLSDEKTLSIFKSLSNFF